MNAPGFDSLELLSRKPDQAHHARPLLFVHGAYAGAWCWDEHFLQWFADHGWHAYALSLSGHGASRGHTHLDSLSIDDYVADVAEAVGYLPEPPILIGHSMGGMVVQKYLERASAPATVLMASVPPQGLMSAAFGLMFKKPHLLADLNRIMGGGEAQLESLRDALFHQPLDERMLERYYRLSQPESHRAIWDMTLFNLPRTDKMHKAPMLVLGAEYDMLIPPDQVHSTAQTYGLKAEIFADMGHGMMLERGWDQVAARIDQWLTEQGF